VELVDKKCLLLFVQRQEDDRFTEERKRVLLIRKGVINIIMKESELKQRMGQ
jgi:hypothetical protein